MTRPPINATHDRTHRGEKTRDRKAKSDNRQRRRVNGQDTSLRTEVQRQKAGSPTPPSPEGRKATPDNKQTKPTAQRNQKGKNTKTHREQNTRKRPNTKQDPKQAAPKQDTNKQRSRQDKTKKQEGPQETQCQFKDKRGAPRCSSSGKAYTASSCQGVCSDN